MKNLAIVLLAALAASPGLCAENRPPKTLRLRWPDLDRVVTGHHINITLPSDIYLEGDVLGMRDDGLLLEVKVTSDKRAYPRGRALVPRAEVKRFRLVRKRGHTWRIEGAALGGGIGFLGGAAAAMESTSMSSGAAIALGTGVGTGVGFLCGLAGDYDRADVIVQPEAVQSGVLP
jgi:hypothetical protein